MTVQEASQIVHLLHTAYCYDSKATPQELADRINLYAVFFADYPAETVRTAAMAWVKHNKWLPALHDLKEYSDNLLRLGKTLAGARVIGEGEIDPETDQYLEQLCEFVGLGYPNENED